MSPTNGWLSESAPRLEVRLVSPSSDFLAGAAITVDGGYSVQG